MNKQELLKELREEIEIMKNTTAYKLQDIETLKIVEFNEYIVSLIEKDIKGENDDR